MVHRTKSRRFTVCAAAAVLLLAWYVASPPFVFPVAETFVPKAMPGLRVIYGPVEAYAVNQDLPGSKLYGTYIGRTVPVVKNALNPINPHATLLEPTQVEFRQTPLRDVLSYMSEIHGVELELDVGRWYQACVRRLDGDRADGSSRDAGAPGVDRRADARPDCGQHSASV
jgi:hypothetical protein